MWLKATRTVPIRTMMATLNRELIGHYACYGVTDNFRSIARFRDAVIILLKKWLNRRGRSGCMSWEKMGLLLK